MLTILKTHDYKLNKPTWTQKGEFIVSSLKCLIKCRARACGNTCLQSQWSGSCGDACLQSQRWGPAVTLAFNPNRIPTQEEWPSLRPAWGPVTETVSSSSPPRPGRHLVLRCLCYLAAAMELPQPANSIAMAKQPANSSRLQTGSLCWAEAGLLITLEPHLLTVWVPRDISHLLGFLVSGQQVLTRMWRNGSVHAAGTNEMEELLCKNWKTEAGETAPRSKALAALAEAPFQHPHLSCTWLSSRGSTLLWPPQSPGVHTCPQTHMHNKISL